MAAKQKPKQKRKSAAGPTIENRRARHEYFIEDTLECGIVLRGTEVKSVRSGRVSLAEGYVRATEDPLALDLHNVHITEYAPAGAGLLQHRPVTTRRLLAHKREIRKLARAASAKGVTIVPLKMYFNDEGRAKVLIGVGRGKRAFDKREDIKRRDADMDMRRAMSKRV